MQAGSLVECLTNEYSDVVKGEIYKVRSMWKCNLDGCPCGGRMRYLAVEENPPEFIDGVEIGYDVRDFREVQPPLEINISEFCKDLNLV